MRLAAAAAMLMPSLFAALPAPAAQVATVIDDGDWCEDVREWSSGESYCEVRELTLSGNSLDLDAGGNGGIEVRAWDGAGIRVRVRVSGQARTQERARAIAGEVRVEASGSAVRAEGPDTSDREWWSSSFRIDVPRQTNLDLETRNGGIDIEGVRGILRFDTTNGGITLDDVGGDVRGTTTNGGVNLRLRGETWEGEGLDVSTTNGGVRVIVPDGYDAMLDLSTTNGGFDVDFPTTLRDTRGRSLSLELGDGGPRLRIETTNGGVKVQRS